MRPAGQAATLRASSRTSKGGAPFRPAFGNSGAFRSLTLADVAFPANIDGRGTALRSGLPFKPEFYPRKSVVVFGF